MPDWSPFDVLPAGTRASVRPLGHAEGVCDRLRAIAFAEQQARDAFLWAAATLTDAEPALQRAWRGLSAAEDSHRTWLLTRLDELGGAPGDRPVAADLWRSLVSSTTAEEFARLMAGAELRGQQAGERMAQKLATSDPTTAGGVSRGRESGA